MARGGFFGRFFDFFSKSSPTNDAESVVSSATAAAEHSTDHFLGIFLGESEPESDVVYVGRIPEELHGVFEQTFLGTLDYTSLDWDEKVQIADEFYARFWQGGYSRDEMREWLSDNGVDPDHFDWKEYSEAYEDALA